MYIINLMIFNLIKKTIRKHWQKDLDQLHKNLSLSFENIRNDMAEIHSFIQQHKEQINHFENRISQMENLPNHPLIENNVTIDNIKKDLTTTQKRIFLAINEVKNKTNSGVCSFKSLSKLLYPNKKPSSINSTISEYIKELENQGLIIKKRVGKEIYVTLTESGHNFIKQLNKKKKKRQKIIQ